MFFKYLFCVLAYLKWVDYICTTGGRIELQKGSIILYCNPGWRLCTCPDGIQVIYSVSCDATTLVECGWNNWWLHYGDQGCDRYSNCEHCNHMLATDQGSSVWNPACMSCKHGYEGHDCTTG